jgi:hypothetical protein
MTLNNSATRRGPLALDERCQIEARARSKHIGEYHGRGPFGDLKPGATPE